MPSSSPSRCGDRRERVLRVGACPSGRPRCEHATTARALRRAATRSWAARRVMRRSSVIAPSRSGTLKSARSSTRVPVAARRSSSCGTGSTMDGAATGQRRRRTRRGRRGGSSSPTRCRTSRAPSPCWPVRHRVERREDARRRVADDVGRHERLVAVLEHAAVAASSDAASANAALTASTSTLRARGWRRGR